MREIFNRNLKVGDLVIPCNDGKLYANNYITKLGILIGDNEIFTKKNQYGKEVYKVINADSCMLFDILDSDEVLLVKLDLEDHYKNHMFNKLKLENRVEEMGSGTLFYKDGKEDWTHAYVYIGKVNSYVYTNTSSSYGTSRIELHDMCFNDEYLYIPYSVILSLTLGKSRTTNSEKLDNIYTVFDLCKIYKHILDKGIIKYNYIHRKEPLIMDKVISKLNLINVESSFTIKKYTTYFGNVVFSV